MIIAATSSGRPPAIAVMVMAFFLTSCGGDVNPVGDRGAPDAGTAHGTPDDQSTPPPSTPSGTGSALLSWQPPVFREDGTALTNLAGYRIEFGMMPEALDSQVTLNNPGLSSYLVDELPSGRWYFTVRAFDDEGRLSARSGMASKLIG